MSFNLNKKGRKIAKINGGSRNGEFVYLSEDTNGFDEIKMDEKSTLQPLPNTSIIEKVYVSAPSGSGKSYYSGKWIKEFMKMKKDDEVYVFSPIPEDKALDQNDIVRVDLDDNLLKNPILIEEFEDSLVVFDDCESIKSKPMKKYIEYLRDSILETGRHYNVRMIWISHLISNYSDTRRLLNESTSVTVFPRSGSGTYQIKKFLINQCGLSRDEIKRFLSVNSRWCTIYRSYPQYVIHEKGVYFPKIDD